MIRNNVFVCDQGNIISLRSSEDALIERNIFYAPGKGITFYNASGGRFADNLYCADQTGFDYDAVLLASRTFIWGAASEEPRHDILIIGDGDVEADVAAIIDNAPDYHEDLARKLPDYAPLKPRLLGRVPDQAVAGEFPEDSQWENALRLPALTDNRGYQPVKVIETDTRLLRDGKYLYARIMCLNPMLELKPAVTDVPVWRRTCAHITLRAENGNGKRFVLEVAKDGKADATLQPDIERDRVQWLAEARPCDNGWIALMRIQLDEMVEVCGARSPIWRVCVGRHDLIAKGLAPRIQSGEETGARIGDPKFVDPDNHDYRLRADSPALAMGFRPFDPRLAGVVR